MRSKIVGIITARGGSKGIPGKNIKLLAGKPLIAYTIEAAQKSGVFDRLIVSTDCPMIAHIAKRYGCEAPFLRPQELAESTTASLPVIQHAVAWLKEHEGYEPEYVMILQPTSPLRQDFHIREAATLLEKTGADSVVSVSKIPAHYHPRWQCTIGARGELAIFTGEPFAGMVKRRQDLSQTYTRNGAIYVGRARTLFADNPGIYGNRVIAYVMDEKYSVNIDELDDWAYAEAMLKNI